MPLGAPAIYRNIRRWLDSIGIPLGKQPVRAGAPTTADVAEVAAEPAVAG